MVAGSLGLETAYGADPGDAVLHLAYELSFVVLPGWLAYRACSPRPGGALRQLAMGWALGYVLEILAFMLTAATDTRGLLVAYPLLVGAAAVGLIVRRSPLEVRPPSLEPRLSGRLTWLVVAVCLLAVAYVGLAFFSSTPLPGTQSARYSQEFPWAISIAAEAKHHWPIQDPSVSGEPFPYHYFVHIHLAAASQVTGIGLPLVSFRLWILPLVVLFVLQLVVAGRSLARSASVGLIAACLVLLVGQLQLDTRDAALAPVPFLGVFFTYLISSPSFLFGLVMFVPLMTLIGERLVAREVEGRPGDWVLIAIFLIGASNAKIVLLPLIAGGLVLFVGSSWLMNRRAPLAAWLAMSLTLVVLGAVYLLQYRGHSTGLSVDPLHGYDYFTNMPAVSLIKAELMDAVPDFPGEAGLLSAGGIIFGSLGLLAAPLVGLVWVFRRYRLRLETSQRWLLSLFGAGLLALLMLDSPANNQQYFFFTALPAACVLSAQGLWIAWESRPPSTVGTRRFAALGLAWVVVLVGVMFAPGGFDLFSGPDSEAHTYMFWFGGLLLSLILLYMAARRWVGPTRWAAAALVCGAVLAVGALDTPVQKVRPLLKNQTPEAGAVMTPELYGALTWIRDETSPQSVIAVNKQLIETGPYEFSYGAFSERRVFIAGWGYSGDYSDRRPLGTAGGETNNPYPERLKRNQRAFERPDRGDLEMLSEQFGVRYLVVDQVNGSPADLAGLNRAATLVYQAPGVSVFELHRDGRG